MKWRKQRSILLILLSMILFATLLIAVGCKKDIYYTVSFNVDNGTEVQLKTVLENSKSGELPVTNKTDYKFFGWSDAKGGHMNIDKNYIITKDITLYVVFKDASKQLCTVTFSSEGTSYFYKKRTSRVRFNFSLAEEMGFEPTHPLRPIGFRDQPLEPLEYSSITNIISQLILLCKKKNLLK